MSYKLKKNENRALDFIVKDQTNSIIGSLGVDTTQASMVKDIFRDNIQEDAVKIVIDNYDIIKKIIDEDEVLSSNFSKINKLNTEREILRMQLKDYSLNHDELYLHGFEDNKATMNDVGKKSDSYLQNAKNTRVKMTSLYDSIINDLDEDKKKLFAFFYDEISRQDDGSRRGVETSWLDGSGGGSFPDYNLEGPFINPNSNKVQYQKLEGVATNDIFTPESNLGQDDIHFEPFFESLDEYQQQQVIDFMRVYGQWQKNVGMRSHIDNVILGGYDSPSSFSTRSPLLDDQGNQQTAINFNPSVIEGAFGAQHPRVEMTKNLEYNKNLDMIDPKYSGVMSLNFRGMFPLLEPSERNKYNLKLNEFEKIERRIQAVKDLSQAHLNEINIEGNEGDIVQVGLLYSFDEFHEQLQGAYGKTRDYFTDLGINPKLVDLYWKNIQAGNLSDIKE